MIHAHPIMTGTDTVLRLMNRDHILLAHNLPLFQLLVYGMSRVTELLWPMRAMCALIGALTGVAFHLMVRELLVESSAERSALFGALLFTSNPFLVELSIVPFQETLMLGLLLLSFYFYFRRQDTASAGSLALACFTRYEAWAAAPLLALWRRRGVWTLLLFGIAPVSWVLLNRGLSPGGTFVAETPHSFARFWRWAYLAWIAVKNTPAPVLALVLLGTWRLPFADKRLRLLASFLAVFLMAVLFSAHGEDRDPERFVGSREAVLPIAVMTVLVPFGIARTRRTGIVLAAAGIVWSVIYAGYAIARDTSEPHLQLSYQLAQFLDTNVGPRERAMIVARPNDLGSYYATILRKEGEEGVRRAHAIAASLDESPIDCGPTMVHSRLGRSQIAWSGDALGRLAIWSDSGRPLPTARTPRETLRSGSLTIWLYHL